MGIMSFFRKCCCCFGGQSRQKPKISTLVQRMKENAVTVQRRNDEVGLRTGAMGGCASVIYLYQRSNTSDEWLGMRGQHGGGGVASINWPTLFAGVTKAASDRLLIFAAGYSEMDETDISTGLADADASTVSFERHISTNALVFMDGHWEHCADDRALQYDHRPNMPRLDISSRGATEFCG